MMVYQHQNMSSAQNNCPAVNRSSVAEGRLFASTDVEKYTTA